MMIVAVAGGVGGAVEDKSVTMSKDSEHRYWLVKSEPDCYSIDDLKRDKRTVWEGVRNYQARNFLMEMKVGDTVLFYHSSTEPPGVAGLAKVTQNAAPDPTQFDRASQYFDPKASREKPRWFCPTIGFVEKFNSLITLHEIKSSAATRKMVITQTGSRLSVTPVASGEFAGVVALSCKK